MTSTLSYALGAAMSFTVDYFIIKYLIEALDKREKNIVLTIVEQFTLLGTFIMFLIAGVYMLVMATAYI